MHANKMGQLMLACLCSVLVLSGQAYVLLNHEDGPWTSYVSAF